MNRLASLEIPAAVDPPSPDDDPLTMMPTKEIPPPAGRIERTRTERTRLNGRRPVGEGDAWSRAARLGIVTAAMACLLLISGVPAYAGVAGGGQDVDLTEYPLTEVEELPERHQEWLEEVSYIITEAEREVFLRCENDEQRDEYIEEFWRQRDPTPGTEKNEYKDLHYERWEHANKHFGRDTPREGWRTDQGRMYILLGEPMNIKRLPNEQLTYPIEAWFYHQDPELGIPPFFHIMFYKDRGVGEYRLYSPVVDGPMDLLNPAGEAEVRRLQQGNPRTGAISTGFGEVGAAYDVLRRVDAEIAQAALSLVPGDQGSAQLGMASLRSDMMLGKIENIPNRIMPNATYAYRFLTGTTEAEVRFETLPMEATAVPLLDPSGQAFIHFGLTTQGGRLNLREYEDSYYMTFQLAGSLVASGQKVVKDLGERTMQADLEQDEAKQLRSGPLVYLDREPAVPGEFSFDIVMENNVSHEFGRTEFDVDIPAPDPQALSTSPPVVCKGWRRLESYDPYSPSLPFQIGDLAVFPAVNGRVGPDSKPCVFHQVYVPRTRTEPVEVIYRLERDGEVALEKTVWLEPDTADGNGTIDQLVELEVGDLTPGSYQLTMDLTDDVRGPFTREVRIPEPEDEPEEEFVHAQPQEPASDPAVLLDLARQHRALDQIDAAIAILKGVLKRAPEFEDAVRLQTDLLMQAGRYEELNELLEPRLVENPNDVELLLTLAEANFNLGENYDAIRYYERARLAGHEDDPDVLNNLAAAYFAEGEAAKAQSLLEESLSLEPEQPEVERLLDRVRKRVSAADSTSR